VKETYDEGSAGDGDGNHGKEFEHLVRWGRGRSVVESFESRVERMWVGSLG
jgi:hypothetical protein